MSRPASEPGHPGARRSPPGVMQFAGLGLMNALCWAAGLAGGWFVDDALGTSPWFMLLGLVAGVALGVFASRAELRRLF